MSKTVKQIDINKALEITRKGGKVFVITASDKPTIRNFHTLPVGEALSNKSDIVLVEFEEVDHEN
jgi:hypothetical protein